MKIKEIIDKGMSELPTPESFRTIPALLKYVERIQNDILPDIEDEIGECIGHVYIAPSTKPHHIDLVILINVVDISDRHANKVVQKCEWRRTISLRKSVASKRPSEEDKILHTVNDVKFLCSYLINHKYIVKSNNNDVAIPTKWVHLMFSNVLQSPPTIAKRMKLLEKSNDIEFINKAKGSRGKYKEIIKVKNLFLSNKIINDHPEYEAVINHIKEIIEKYKVATDYCYYNTKSFDPVLEQIDPNVKKITTLTKAGINAFTNIKSTYKMCMLCKHCARTGSKFKCELTEETKVWNDSCDKFVATEVLKKPKS